MRGKRRHLTRALGYSHRSPSILLPVEGRGKRYDRTQRLASNPFCRLALTTKEPITKLWETKDVHYTSRFDVRCVAAIVVEHRPDAVCKWGVLRLSLLAS